MLSTVTMKDSGMSVSYTSVPTDFVQVQWMCVVYNCCFGIDLKI